MAARPTKPVIYAQFVALAAALAVVVLSNSMSDWDLALLGTLTAISVISDLIAVRTRVHQVVVSASFLTIVICAVFLGGGPAALMGVTTILVGWIKARYPRSDLLINLVTYAWFPLITGIVFHGVSEVAAIATGSAAIFTQNDGL